MALTTLRLCSCKLIHFTRLFSTNTSCGKTAGIIVIGDEILKGLVADTNSHFMSKILRGIGVEVKKITVVGDSIDDIKDEVKLFSSKFNYVLTCGGIGPTHDDVTYEGVAKAFDEDLVLNPILEKICRNYWASANQEVIPILKTAHIPRSSRLIFGEDPVTGGKLKYPNISVKNVFIFPGIPPLLEKSFSALAEILFQSSKRFYLKTIYLNIPEYSIVNSLNKVVDEFPNVMFGSYPNIANNVYKVKITIESTNREHTYAAYNRVLNLVPKNAVVNFS